MMYTQISYDEVDMTQEQPLVLEDEQLSNIGQVLTVKEVLLSLVGCRNYVWRNCSIHVRTNIFGMALNLEKDQVGCIVLVMIMKLNKMIK